MLRRSRRTDREWNPIEVPRRRRLRFQDQIPWDAAVTQRAPRQRSSRRSCSAIGMAMFCDVGRRLRPLLGIAGSFPGECSAARPIEPPSLPNRTYPMPSVSLVVRRELIICHDEGYFELYQFRHHEPRRPKLCHARGRCGPCHACPGQCFRSSAASS